MSQALLARAPRVLPRLIVETANDKVPGAQMVGEHAADILQVAVIALGMGATRAVFDRPMAC